MVREGSAPPLLESGSPRCVTPCDATVPLTAPTLMSPPFMSPTRSGEKIQCPFSDICNARVATIRQHIREHFNREAEPLRLLARYDTAITSLLRRHELWLCVCNFRTYKLARACTQCHGVAPDDGRVFTLPPAVPQGVVPAIPDTDAQPVVDQEFRPASEDANVFRFIRSRNVRTIRSIPRSSRIRFTVEFRRLLRVLVLSPHDLDAHARLGIFIKCVLRHAPRSPNSSAKKIPQSKTVKSNLDRWLESEASKKTLWLEVLGTLPPVVTGDASSTNNNRRCIKLAGLGRYGDAAKSLVSNGVANLSPAVVAELVEKHPQHFAAPERPVRPEQPVQPLRATPEKVEKAIRSFPRGTAGGNDGLHAQHLVDMLNTHRAANEDSILYTFTDFVNVCLAANLPLDLAPFMSSAPLTPLLKKDNSIRPIAVGEIWRRLVSKIASAHARHEVCGYLMPLQLGVGIPNATEAITHAIRSSVNKFGHLADRALFKVDFANAFNVIDRSVMLREVWKVCPSIAAWVEYCYASAPLLFIGDEADIFSTTGVQQGDPLGPLLFAITLHILVLELSAICPAADVHLWYLDDGNIIGSPEVISRFFDTLSSRCPDFGLQLNLSKCELWWPTLNPDIWSFLPVEVPINQSAGTDILGSAVGSGAFIDQYVQNRVGKIRVLVERLNDLEDPQVQLLLLRSAIGMPKFVFALRTCPTGSVQLSIAAFEEVMDLALYHIWRRSISYHQRLLINLPLRLGGLGIPKSSSIGQSAFLGSMVQCSALIQSLNITSVDAFTDEILYTLLGWNGPRCVEQHITLEQIEQHKKPQAFLSEVVFKSQLQELLDNSKGVFKNVVHGGRLDGSFLWTTTVPGPGFKMNPLVFRTALQLRTGHKIFDNSTMCPCQKTSDVYGIHDSFCQKGGKLIRRHDLIRNTLANFCREALLSPTTEERGLLREDVGNRPADIFIPDFNGHGVCIDVTVVSSLKQDAQAPGVNAAQAEDNKNQKYRDNCSKNGFHFIPFVIESLGGFGRQALTFLDKLAVMLAERKGMDVPKCATYLRRKINFVAIQATASVVACRLPFDEHG